LLFVYLFNCFTTPAAPACVREQARAQMGSDWED